ncbi:hypothetical protein RFI_30421 [Reticulomyxa filosa]|uniref:Uncharacterized protein n=1 Tax=Reticulomyxa filosa TaxID=46433 RepID=X6M0P5_RETFI|nr:hypothetical protein RFI_30421 [Reticulomyxa filosa]|eukprot:ETO06972.1 hypothetical protein RFI_30421 [Reticulomyxa filosa]
MMKNYPNQATRNRHEHTNAPSPLEREERLRPIESGCVCDNRFSVLSMMPFLFGLILFWYSTHHLKIDVSPSSQISTEKDKTQEPSFHQAFVLKLRQEYSLNENIFNAFLQVDRAEFCNCGLDAYIDAPQSVGFDATISVKKNKGFDRFLFIFALFYFQLNLYACRILAFYSLGSSHAYLCNEALRTNNPKLESK